MKFAKLLSLGCALVLASCGGDDTSNASSGDGYDIDGTKITIAPVPSHMRGKAAKQVFGHLPSPNNGPAQSIGFYSRGCISGAQQLPETGPTWQAMRLSRNRNYGHPQLVDFIAKLSQRARDEAGWAGLYVGDMSQPRGGPMLTGHASHQSGLDADIWALPPQRLNLSPAERENISSVSMVTGDYKNLSSNWTDGHFKVIRAAAQDDRVERIFVTPRVKMAMCDMETGNRSYLSKIRPWWGHNYHFHVRLKCQPGSPNCEPQTPPDSSTDGCAHAREFYGMYISKTIPVPPSKPSPKKPPLTMDNMPAQCVQVAQ